MGKSRALNILRSRSEKIFSCSMCRYSSTRYFNITRHERRIHTVPKKQPQCCDTTFETKAEYYRHCEEVHPGKRINLTSQIKYGIRAGSILNDSIDDVNTVKQNYQEFPQTRYMLRSRLRPRDSTKLAESSLDSDENSDIDDDSINRTDKSSRYKNSNSFSMNSTSSYSELPDDDDDSCEHDFASDDDQQNDEESSEGDFYSDDQQSSNKDDNVEKNETPMTIDNKTPMKIDEAPASASVFEERDDRENVAIAPLAEPREGSVSSSQSDLTSSKSDESALAKHKSANYDVNDESKIGFDSESPITSTPSTLPLKKRILQDLGIQNRQNIEKSRKPISDRLYRTPMKLEWKIERISKKCRKSREERLTLRKTVIASQSCSISNDAENVPPEVSLVHSDGAFKVEFHKNVKSSWQQVTKDHREYLRAIGVLSLGFF